MGIVQPQAASQTCRKALEISPDCADAYMLLAQEGVQSDEETLALYEQAVEAGKRALGEDFEEYKGDFWLLVETRPYMRARLALAQFLLAKDEAEQAADHLEALLELNPSDNQGARYIYISVLLELGDEMRLKKLLKEFPGEDNASWRYSEALHKFRKHGGGFRAGRALKKAISQNPYVPDFLLGRREIPAELPGYYAPGDEVEAVDYVLSGIRAWQATPDALLWLHQMTA